MKDGTRGEGEGSRNGQRGLGSGSEAFGVSKIDNEEWATDAS